MQASNSFPYAVSLQMEGPGANALNAQGRANGGRVAVSMSPGELVRCNQSLYTPDPLIHGSHFRDYAHCTKESVLRDIVKFNDKPFCYVPKNHEVVNIINKNSGRLNLVLSDSDLVEGSAYYRVDTGIVDRVVEELHSNVLSKMPFVDLSRLRVNLHRTDNKAWTAMAGSKIEGMQEKVQAAHMAKPNHVRF